MPPIHQVLEEFHGLKSRPTLDPPGASVFDLISAWLSERSRWFRRFNEGFTLLNMLIKLDETIDWNRVEQESAIMESYLNTTFFSQQMDRLMPALETQLRVLWELTNHEENTYLLIESKYPSKEDSVSARQKEAWKNEHVKRVTKICEQRAFVAGSPSCYKRD